MAKWVRHFDLILFDFDGLLVNTEELHCAAYREMCRGRGVELDWDFEQFCGIAHFDAVGIRDQIYRQFPQLKEAEPNWSVLYAEKKRAYLKLLEMGGLELMPGVEPVLQEIKAAGIRHCVVTNSPAEQIERIRESLPVLKSIPVWITREQYERPKPAPDGYLVALKRLKREGDRVVGFEDSIRGFRSLQAAGCPGVLISGVKGLQVDGVRFGSFEEIPESFQL